MSIIRTDEKSPNISVDAQALSKEFDFGDRRIAALDEATFRISQGEFVVILGPSGAGKTTLLNLIGGLDRPTRGTIAVNGTNLANLDEEALSSFRSKRIGFIFQTYNLISTLTALENVQFPMKLAGCKDEPLIESRSRDLLTQVGLMHRSDHLPFQMSCGEQQRAAIARALANDPPLILADEPTGNLDWGTGLEMINFLKDLGVKQGKTMVIVTHDERIVALADATLKLSNGRIAEIARST
jgi:ABC-type lipoprotein export system ATPase subunit